MMRKSIRQVFRPSVRRVFIAFLLLLFAAPVFASDPALLKMEGQIQVRFQWDEEAKEFTIPRTRLGAEGQAFPQINYKLEIDAVPAQDRTRVSLKDAKIVLTGLGSESPWAHLTVGHFKVPFSRARLTSEKNFQFILRPEAVEKESPDRDIGAMVSRFLADQKFEYATGVFNGAGTSNSNEDGKFAWAARVAAHPFGRVPYSEGDPESAPDLKLVFGAGVYYDGRPPAGGPDQRKWTLDAAARRKGVSIEAGYLAGDPFHSGGFLAGGVLLFDRWEPAARYEFYRPDAETLRAATVGVNYFVSGHDVKIQVNEIFRNREPDTFLAQLQAAF